MHEFRETAPRKQVYIVRIWETRCEAPGGESTWRFSTEDPQTGERRGFASLQALMDFLAGQTGQRGYRRAPLWPWQGPDEATLASHVGGATGIADLPPVRSTVDRE